MKRKNVHYINNMEYGVAERLAIVAGQCAAAKHRPALLASGWMTIRVFSDEVMSHTCSKSYYSQINRYNLRANGLSWQSLK